jgi:TolB-like protein
VGGAKVIRIGAYTLKILTLLLILSVAGCTQLPDGQSSAAQGQIFAEDTLLYRTERLANKLFANLGPLAYGKLGVVSFTELESLALSQANYSLNMLGLQLQESMIAISAQRGFKVVEIRAAKQISLFNDHERLLTREQSEINDTVDVRYMVVGTLSQGAQHTTVNARLLDLQESVVVTAVSEQIPNTIIGLNTNQIQMKHQKLYRSSLLEVSSK